MALKYMYIYMYIYHTIVIMLLRYFSGVVVARYTIMALYSVLYQWAGGTDANPGSGADRIPSMSSLVTRGLSHIHGRVDHLEGDRR